MYPYEIIFGLDLYSILMCVGIFVCIMVFYKLADVVHISWKLQRLCYITAIFAITLGYGSAVLFQAFYNIKKNGGFVIDSNTGATFYGGLIGGAGVFLLIYFVAGHFMFSDGYHKRNFFKMANCAATSIAIAHSIGRVGCLMAGCCHGAETDAWYGIVMNGKKYVPVQLFEAIFLTCLFAWLTWRVIKGKSFNLPLYMICYGVWRFFIEYARGDYRGSTVVSFVSPSQLVAIIFVIGGVALLLFEASYERKHKESSVNDVDAENASGEVKD